MKKTYIVIGTSAAGFNALLQLQKLEPNATLIGITQEASAPYNKCLLVDYLVQQKNKAELFLRNPSPSAFTLLCNTTVTAIKPEMKKIILNNKEELSYHKLLLTTGTRPYIPSFFHPFMHIKGIITFHTLSDTQAIIDQLNITKECVIVGAGINGLECASALQRKGYTVTVVEKASVVMPSLRDLQASLIIENYLTSQGIRFYKERTIEHIFHKNNILEGIILSGKEMITTSLLILATGTLPNTEYAPFLVQEKGKFIVNDTFQTSNPDIYAAGDCIHDPSRSISSFAIHQWSTAVMQGLTAAFSMTGQTRYYKPLPPIIQTTLGNLTLCFGGNYEESGSISHNSISHDYEKIIVNKQGNLQGFMLIGKIEKALTVRQKFTKEWLSNV